MKNKKGIALLISLALVIGTVLPGTLALSTDQAATNGELTVTEETQTPTPEVTETPTPTEEPKPTENPVPSETEKPAETEAPKECTCSAAEGEAHKEGCPLYVAPEQPAEAEKTCTCDPAPAEGEAHKEGCPLYVAPEKPAEAEKTCTWDPAPAEGEEHLEGCPPDAASMVEFTEICAAYTDDDLEQFEKWVVENEMLDSLQSHINVISPAPTMPETVVFTDAGPFMPPVEVADSGSGN